MTERPMTKEEEILARMIQKELQGLSPLEQSLVLIENFREVYGGEWTLAMNADGTWLITRKQDK